MFLPVDDAVLRTCDLGPGPRTVLAINGWAAALELWLPTFELLSTDTRCIGFDLRGTGGSTADAASITLDALVDDAFCVLDAHGVERCTLAGESLGGFLALNVYLRHPERFDALVLVAAPPFVTADVVGRLVDGARADYPATIRAFVRECLNEADQEHLHHWGEQLFLGADPEVAARLFECCYDVFPALDAIAVPTTVVYGSLDAVVAPSIGQFLAGSIPGARFVELEGAGHAPMITRPTEVAAIVRGAATVSA